MSSIDARIERAARQRQEVKVLQDKHRDGELRELLYDEVRRILLRAAAHGIADEDMASWLHCRSYDQTYHDYGAESKQFRTRKRFELLLALCDGDKKLLLEEYAKVLNAVIPVSSPYFSWAPRLYRPNAKRITVIHNWKHVSPEG